MNQLVKDFLFRSWLGLVSLAIAITWYVLPNTTDYCTQTAYFSQIWWVLLVMMFLGGIFTIWEMSRVHGTEEYQYTGMAKFVIPAVLLSLWTIFMCSV